MDDRQYMKRALELAEKGMGRTNPNPLVGAVIVKNGKIIGEGYHERYGQAHAEVNAINRAAESVENATLYVNLEPCSHFGKTPPCADLIIERKIGRVVIGSLDPNPKVAGQGVQRLKNAGIQVEVGMLDECCKRLNEVFFHYITTGTPFVVMKTAMSLDGKIATSSGESKWITGEPARSDVQRLRNQLTGIMVGVNTVIQDDPLLTCRMEGGRNPRRIIVDSTLRIPDTSQVLRGQQDNPTIIATVEETGLKNPQRIRDLEKSGVEIIFCKSVQNRVDLKDLMEKLGQRKIDSILLEGGATLNDSALKQGIVQKIISYIAPMIIGGEGSKTPVGGKGVEALNDAYQLTIDQVEPIGPDIKITAYRK